MANNTEEYNVSMALRVLVLLLNLMCIFDRKDQTNTGM
jgi:hypothetical protein